MAVKYMSIVNVDNYQQKNESVAYEYEESLSEVASSDWLIIPINVKNISVALIFTGTATAKVQTTVNKLQDVIDGSAGVVAFDWTSGGVSVNTEDSLVPVTAIRLNVTAYTDGVVKILVRAQ